MRKKWAHSVQYTAIVATTLIAVVITGCRSERVVEPTSLGVATEVTIQLSEDERIFDAALRYLLYDDWKDYWADYSEKRFVEFAGADPSDTLLVDYSKYEPPLHKASGCNDTFDGVFDNDTGRPAFLYRISAPDRIDEEMAEVQFYLRGGGWGFTTATLTVEKVDGTWKVTGQGQIMKG